jgi:hypothetical protein
MQRRKTWLIWVFGILAAGVCGCGGNDYEVAAVHGKVTCNDKPVPGGQIQFVAIVDARSESPPIATGEIDENGNYTLTTYSRGDGAVLGKHRVIYVRPRLHDFDENTLEQAEQDDDPQALEELKADIELAKKLADLPGDVPDEDEVTVVAGDNEFEIELVKSDDPENLGE